MLLNLFNFVVLDVIEPLYCIMVPDVMEPSYLRFRCYKPVIVGGFMVTTLPDVIGIK